MVVSSGATYQGPRFWWNEEAPSNIPDMSMADETSHSDMSPLKDVALRNIPDMSVTRERSGESAALYIMLEAPANASRIVVHWIPPHLSIDTSLAAFVWSPPSCILEKFPDIPTVWSPGVV